MGWVVAVAVAERSSERSGKARRAQRGNSQARRAKTSVAQAWFTRGTIKAHDVAFDSSFLATYDPSNKPNNCKMCRIENVEK